MALDKNTLQQDLIDLMTTMEGSTDDPDNWQKGWATAMDAYIKSGTPTPASPSFDNTTGTKTILEFSVSNDIISATNLATAFGAYVGALLVPVGGDSATNTAIVTSSVLAGAIIPTTEDNEYQILVDAIDVWVKSVVWTITVSGSTSTATLQ